MSSFVDNVKNLNEKGAQCTYSCEGGPVWQIRVFPAPSPKSLEIEYNTKRFNIRHFANHYAHHCHQWDPYPTNLEEILDNIRVAKGDDLGIQLTEALRTFDAERLHLLGTDEYYAKRISPYLERVAAAAAKPDREAIIIELYTLLQEPKMMAFARRNPTFEETMIAKAEELRAIHYLEFPELNLHLQKALHAYGISPKRLPSKNEVVMANFAKLPANLYVYAKTPMFCNPHYGILNGDTVWNPLLNSLQSLEQFLAKFSKDNFVQWPLSTPLPTAIPDILPYIYSGDQNLYQLLANWTEGSKDLLVHKTKEEIRERDLALKNFSALPDGIQVRIQAYDFVRCDWGILYPSRQTLYCHQLRCELSLLVFFNRFIDSNNDVRMFETRPTTLKEFLENIYTDKYAVPLYERLKTWTKAKEADLSMDTPAEMIDRLYGFVPDMMDRCEPDCMCGGALEEEKTEEAEEEENCSYSCSTEHDLRSSIERLEQQLKAAVKRIQLIEEARE